ncbi:MAG: hypothetical protein R3B57_15130, partial [Phycisphaerales bacterium]
MTRREAMALVLRAGALGVGVPAAMSLSACASTRRKGQVGSPIPADPPVANVPTHDAPAPTGDWGASASTDSLPAGVIPRTQW